MDIVPIVSILSVFVIAPAIVFSFIYLTKQSRHRVEELRYRKEILELEIEKEEAHARLLEAENAKYDRLISDKRN
jgi:hypothetical protein